MTTGIQHYREAERHLEWVNGTIAHEGELPCPVHPGL